MGTKTFFVKDVLGDYLEFHTELLTANGKILVRIIREEIEKCEKAANIVNHLTEDLKKAAGDCSGEKTQYGKEEYFLPDRYTIPQMVKGIGSDR